MAKTNVWMSVSDLMTGLMVVFLFVSIAYMMQATQKLTEFVDTKQKLHEELKEKFKEQIGDSVLAVNNDLSIRISQAESLFEDGEYYVSERFENILQDFIPDYMNILLHDSLRTHIKEIRVEGHTDTKPFRRFGTDSYLSNLELSQKRAYYVVKCIRKICEENDFAPEDQKQIQDWLTAVGYSYTYALDANGEYISKSKKPIDEERSKRVEIRIITDDYRVVEESIRDK